MELSKIQEVAKERFARYPRLILATVAVLVIGVVFAFVVLRNDDSELFATALDTAQITEVDARLAEWGTWHVIVDGSIRVKSNSRNDLLLRLALVGLPHPHIPTSDETLAKLNALTPDAVFQAQARAGNAGDLAVALRGIDGVVDASVVIAPAVTQAFSDQPQVQASAAVRISLRSGMTLTPAAIEGIRTFIASGVPGLDRQHVTILDDHGSALGGAVVHDEAETARLSLQSAFDEAFGAGVTIVRVHVKYTDSERREREIQRLPIVGIALKEDHTIEHLSDKQRRYERSEQHDEHGSIVREAFTHSVPGRPVGMAVAVLIDEHAHLDLAHVRGLAAASVGLDGNQGDTLVVEEVAFRHPLLVEPNRVVAWGPMATIFSGIMAVAALFLWRNKGEAQSKDFVRSFVEKKFLKDHPWVQQVHHNEYDSCELHRLLQREPAYMVAAVLGGLPAATAAKVLELYPAEERSAIVAKMARPVAPYLCDWKEAMGSAASGMGLENSFKRNTIVPHSPRH